MNDPVVDHDLEGVVDDLVKCYGLDAIVIALKKHQAKRPGRPAKRNKNIMESDEFLVWITVERYKHAHPKASDDEACRIIAEEGGAGFLAYDKNRNIVPVTIHDNHRGIARILSEAKKMRRESPALASAWNRQLNTLLGRDHLPEDLAPSPARQ